ncbi:hypothetical protein EDD11_001785 [Mortierella claussenii]|nr:hypothetical protein EDD11_001785 [Mortierella claussenii]
MATSSSALIDSTLASSTTSYSQSQQNYGSVPCPRPPTSRKDITIAYTSTTDTTTGTESAAGTKAASRRSVQIAIPEDDDDASISSISSYSTYSSSASSINSTRGGANGHLRSGSHKYRNAGSEGDDVQDNPQDTEWSARQIFWTYVALSPVLLSIWGLFAALLLLLPFVDNGSTIPWDRFGVGTLGWTMAFAARTPIYAFFERTLCLNWFICEWSTLLSAGVMEEAIRLGIITLLGIGGDFEAVYWLGLGWAAVETLYYIGQSLFYSRWISDDDYRAATNMAVMSTVTNMSGTTENDAIKDVEEETEADTGAGVEQVYALNEQNVPPRQLKHLLGIDRPWWSLMGRTSSMMVHIGLSCWLGYSGWKLLAPAALIHGTLYVTWGALMPEHLSVPATSYGTLMTASSVFLIGLALYGEIV